MLVTAEELAAVRIDMTAPASLIGLQLDAQRAGAAQVAALRALLLPEDAPDE